MGTKIISRPLYSKDQTSQQMHRLINNYSNDVEKVMIENGGNITAFSRMPINQAFDTVKNIPYRRDRIPVEVVSRPEISFRNSDAGLDCKKKSIIIASYLKNRNIPYRLMATSKRPDGRVHHVFPQMKFGNNYYSLDATFPQYEPFQEKNGITNQEVLTDTENSTVELGLDFNALSTLFDKAGELAEPIKKIGNIFAPGTPTQTVDLINLQQNEAKKQQELILMIGIPAVLLLLTLAATKKGRK